MFTPVCSGWSGYSATVTLLGTRPAPASPYEAIQSAAVSAPARQTSSTVTSQLPSWGPPLSTTWKWLRPLPGASLAVRRRACGRGFARGRCHARGRRRGRWQGSGATADDGAAGDDRGQRAHGGSLSLGGQQAGRARDRDGRAVALVVDRERGVRVSDVGDAVRVRPEADRERRALRHARIEGGHDERRRCGVVADARRPVAGDHVVAGAERLRCQVVRPGIGPTDDLDVDGCRTD